MPAPKGHKPYPGCETGGRPKIYTKDFIERAAEQLEKWMEDKDNIFIERFCYEFKYPEEKITDFASESEKFSQAYKRLKTKQKFSVIEGGLKRKYAHTMCSLVLSVNHNWYQKTEQKVTTTITDPIEFIINENDGKSKDLVNG